MSITTISRDLIGKPHIVRITDDDNLATITAADYIATQKDSIFAANSGEFSFSEDDLILINYSDGEEFFKYDLATNTFVISAVSDGSVTLDSLAPGIKPAAIVVVRGSLITSGGQPLQIFPITGVPDANSGQVNYFIQTQLTIEGAAPQRIVESTFSFDGSELHILFTADPAADHQLDYIISRIAT